MNFQVHEVARIIRAEVIGNNAFVIKGVNSFENACETDITFADAPKFLKHLDKTNAKVIIVPDTFDSPIKNVLDKIILRTPIPRISFFKVVSLFHPPKEVKSIIHTSATLGQNLSIGENPVIEANVYIGDDVTIGNHVHLMPGVYIGDGTCIGDYSCIKPNVTIMDRSQIGSNVIIHSNTVIGSDGFGFAQDNHHHQKLPHTGYVNIGNNSEIGACNTIDRGTLGVTHIGEGVKTDNQVHIAHNVKIGNHTLLVAQVGIAGSTQIGNNVIIAGKAAVTGHIKVGDNTIIGPYSGVTGDVPENQIVSGIPHMPHKAWLKVSRILSRLPELRKKMLSLEKKLKALENKNKQME